MGENEKKNGNDNRLLVSKADALVQAVVMASLVLSDKLRDEKKVKVSLSWRVLLKTWSRSSTPLRFPCFLCSSLPREK